MYLAQISIKNFRCFGETPLVVHFNSGLTALVGENDAGKTAVIDAIRYALGTTDQEWQRIEDDDFHKSGAKTASSITIHCEFRDLKPSELADFIEHLTYGRASSEPATLHVHWTAKSTGKNVHGRTYRRAEVNSGPSGEGPTIPHDVRMLLQATYLRPLRDAEQALAAGRGSRAARIVSLHDGVKNNDATVQDFKDPSQWDQVGLAGIAALIEDLLHRQKDLKAVSCELDDHLSRLSVQPAQHRSTTFKVSKPSSPELQLRALLEKLDLQLDGPGTPGLGTNNALFMACELLQLGKAKDALRLLLIEEPEAHLHAQRQLRVMQYLQEHANDGLQVIVTTHSPNLASVIKLDNIVMIDGGKAHALSRGKTMLDGSDYEFLERFLDATKANLFFARGVLIVEGDAENLLLPTIARLLGRDLTKHGVSIVNVGGTGLGRYARIFQRIDDQEAEAGDGVRVACLTDLDVMPDCAEELITKKLPTRSILGEEGLATRRVGLEQKATGQGVRTFVADWWTFEYDLAYCGLAEDVYIAAHLANEKRALDESEFERESDVAAKEFAGLKADSDRTVSISTETGQELLATRVYARILDRSTSKAILAQYLAKRLGKKQPGPEELRAQLPKYITGAIDYVTGASVPSSTTSSAASASDA